MSAVQQMQTAAALSAMGGGGGLFDVQALIAKVQGFDIKDPVGSCSGGLHTDAPGEEEDQDNLEVVVAGAGEESKKFHFRMCVFSGKNFPRERAYVKATVTFADGTEKIFQSEPLAESQTPVWEYMIEQELELSPSSRPYVEINIMGSRTLGGDVILGSAALSLQARSTHGAKRWTPKCRTAEKTSIFNQNPSTPSLLVTYQMAEHVENVADLQRVSELDSEDWDVKRHTIALNVLEAKLRQSTNNEQKYKVKVECFQTGLRGRKDRRDRTSPAAPSAPDPNDKLDWPHGEKMFSIASIAPPAMGDLVSVANVADAAGNLAGAAGNFAGAAANIAGGAAFGSAGKTKNQEQGKTGKVGSHCKHSLIAWKEDKDGSQQIGWQMEPWKLEKSRVQLMDFTLRFTLQQVVGDGELDFQEQGSWEEDVSELIDSIEDTNAKLWFRAELKTKWGATTAHVKVEMDIFHGAPHKSQRLQLAQATGGQSAEKVKLGQRVGNPSIREGNRPMTYFISVFGDNLSGRHGDRCDPYVKFIMGAHGRGRTKRLNNRAFEVDFGEPTKIQVKAKETKLRVEVWNDNSLIGSSLLMGSLDTMVGLSTVYDVVPNTLYWRHLFGGAQNAERPDEAVQMSKGAIRPASTYHGTIGIFISTKPRPNPNMWQNALNDRSKCTLVVRLYRGLYFDHYKSQQVKVLIQVPGCRLEIEKLPEEKDPKKAQRTFAMYNSFVLSFPGFVDQYGVLRFSPEERLNALESFMAAETVDTKNVAWVERSTSLKEPLLKYPAVSHCYLYIVRAGDDEINPEVFGRMRLQKFVDGPATRPKWRRMMYDASVLELPKSHFKDDLAGVMLGSAMIIEHGGFTPSGGMGGNIGTNTQTLGLGSKTENLDFLAASANAPIGDGASPKLQQVSSPEDIELPGDTMGDHNLDAAIQTQSEGAIAEDRQSAIPKSTKSSSVLCRPCVGETHLYQGSTGDTVRWRMVHETLKKTVYCHVDVLAARSLQAMDEDGLADPAYSLRIEDKQYNSDTEAKSLDPMFMDRFVIPVVVEQETTVSGAAELLPAEPAVPLPPVLMRMFDRDTNLLMEQAEKAMDGEQSGVTSLLASPLATLMDQLGDQVAYMHPMGCILMKHPKILDVDRQPDPTKEKGIDINNLHEAMWFSLDTPGKTHFDKSNGGVEETWKSRPRVLLAAGFSMEKDVAGVKPTQEFYEEQNTSLLGDGSPLSLLQGEEKEVVVDKVTRIDMVTQRAANFKIVIDLLGLRNLPSSIITPELSINSFWEGGPVAIQLGAFSNSNPNFEPEAEDEDTDSFVKIVKPICKIGGQRCEDQGMLGALGGAFTGMVGGFQAMSPLGGGGEESSPGSDEGGGVGELDGAGKADDSDEDNKEVQFQDILGYRVIAPQYTVPVIGYLQKSVEAGGGFVKRTRGHQDLLIWRKARKNGPLPENALEAGHTLSDGAIYVARVGGEAGKVGLYKSDKTLQAFQGPFTDNVDTMEVLTLKPEAEAAWVSLQKGDDIPGQAVRSGVEDKHHSGNLYVGRIGYEEVGCILTEKKGDDAPEKFWKFKSKVHQDAQQSAYILLVKYKELSSSSAANWALSRLSAGAKHATKDAQEALGLARGGDLSMDLSELKKNTEDFVLMPDLVMQLRNRLTLYDYGTVSCSLPIGNSIADADQESWAMSSIKQYADLMEYQKKNPSKKLLDAKPLLATQMEDAYETFVDIFSSTKGHMYFNKDLRMGRAVRGQHICSVWPELPNESDSSDDDAAPQPVPHMLNPMDFSQSPKYASESFEKFSPVLYCGKWEKKQGSTDPNCWNFVSTRGSPDSKMPKPLKELCGRAFGHVGSTMTEKNLRTYTTKEMRQAAKAHHFRCVSHLHQFEPVEEDKPSGEELIHNMHCFIRPIGHQIRDWDRDSRFIARLRMGLSGVMLDRLQKPDSEEGHGENKKRIKEIQDSMCNFMTIKFTRSGTIVWSVPEDQWEFKQPGEVLFVVRLDDGSGFFVPVYVPIFDLRYTRETSWFVKKTLKSRWAHLENGIKRAQDIKRKRERKKLGKNAATGLDPNQDDGGTAEKEKADKQAAEPKEKRGRKLLEADMSRKTPLEKEISDDDQPPNGYTKPIPVAKYAFVCRIQKRHGTNIFDRVRTRNWYRTMLSDTFPEVAKLEVDDFDDWNKVKNFFFARFLNLRKSLVVGEMHDSVGTVKGHITVKRLEDSDGVKVTKQQSTMGMQSLMTGMKNLIQVDDSKKPQKGLRPIQNLWIRSEVNVNVYILTGRNMVLDSSVGSDTPNLYLKGTLLGSELDWKMPNTIGMYDKSSVDFYEHFMLTPQVPGATTLRLELWHKPKLSDLTGGLSGDVLVGYLEVDLEDRNLLLRQRMLRASTNREFLESRISPDDTMRFMKVKKSDKYKKASMQEPAEQLTSSETTARTVWFDPELPEKAKPGAQDQTTCRPHILHDNRCPIEGRDLVRVDQDTEMEMKVGLLRYWVDITPCSDPYPDVTLQSDQKEFEVRVTIWGIKEISIFQDFGERNDVFVRAKMTALSANGDMINDYQDTDIHKWAHDSANFNWNVAFVVKCPTIMADIEFSMFDADRISDADPIYDSEVMAMDQYLTTAYFRQMDGEPTLPTDLSKRIVFASWPSKQKHKRLEPMDGNGDKKEKAKRWCCSRKPKPMKPPKPAKMTIDVTVLPKEEADKIPFKVGRIGEQDPPGRMNWTTAAANPGKFIKILLGPNNVIIIVKMLVTLIFFIVAITILYVLYLYSAIHSNAR
eukprot:TRINITY_DN33197_c0_g1_i1.p1 TRINITY_DN33197_c0_g1~~TRINITY_DN33197_c0_g1_i1.p1  ORF type:complete len:2741 (-),score=745.43 TRINITY_DN33197_c0_g1_i1:71-8293(-)